MRLMAHYKPLILFPRLHETLQDVRQLLFGGISLAPSLFPETLPLPACAQPGTRI